MIKRFVSAVLCVMLAVTSTTFAFSASGNFTVSAAEKIDLNVEYYYDQLSESGKKLYRELKEAVLDCQEVVEIKTSMSGYDFDSVSELLAYHDPETFNISGLGAYWGKNSSTFVFEYRYDKKTFDAMTKAYKDKANEILGTLDKNMSEYEKIMAIHDEIAERSVYDCESANSDTVYGALVEQKAKCDGYAKTFAYICGEAGIKTVTVIGAADRGDNNIEMHMWNKVYCDENWYNIDVTWDDPMSDVKDNMSMGYFMISDDGISKSHMEIDLSFHTPEAKDDTIDYYKTTGKYAEDTDSAKEIMKAGLAEAAKNGEPRFEFKCSSEEVLKAVDSYLNDVDSVEKMLNDVNAVSEAEMQIIPTLYSYAADDELNVIYIMVFYQGTDLSYYFTDPDSISNEKLQMLNAVGIK